MHYIITTTADDPHVGTPAMERVTVTRTAVATLDEARDVVTGIVEEREPFSHKVQETAGSNLSAMRESGGTVGPLPDGTVIEVRRVRWSAIADELPEYMPLFADGGYNKAILAAFNGAHA